MTEKASEIASIESEMTEVQGLITAAKEAERRRHEAEEAAKQQAQQNNGNSGGTAGDSVVSGNGFFTHPCPGMSYQSSYFGEVREGIGDSRPHKGHDYAAAPWDSDLCGSSRKGDNSRIQQLCRILGCYQPWQWACDKIYAYVADAVCVRRSDSGKRAEYRRRRYDRTIDRKPPAFSGGIKWCSGEPVKLYVRRYIGE